MLRTALRSLKSIKARVPVGPLVARSATGASLRVSPSAKAALGLALFGGVGACALTQSEIVGRFAVLHVAKEDNLDDVVESLPRNTKLFVLVTAARKEGGDPWCPDCTKAEPLVYEALRRLGEKQNVTLVQSRVTRESYKGNPDHPYRKHSMLKLQAIPTLYAFDTYGQPKSMVEEDLHNFADVENFVA